LAWRELLAGGAAWLAHFAWYAGHAKRRSRAPEAGPSRASRRGLSWLAPFMLVVSWASWISAHGPVLGSGSALAALTAAASINTLVAPLSPRLGWVLGGAALAAVLVGLVGWLAHA
jgi:hypothetical protein